MIHTLHFSKSKKLHRSHFYCNSINVGTIKVRSQLLIIFVSAKVQDCIGVAYTATQSTLEVFNLEVNFSSSLFQPECKIAQEMLIQQLSQYWNYSSQKLIIHQLHFSQSCKIAQQSLIQQLSQYWNFSSQKLIIHQLHFSQSARLHSSHLYSNSVNTGTIQARS